MQPHKELQIIQEIERLNQYFGKHKLGMLIVALYVMEDEWNQVPPWCA